MAASDRNRKYQGAARWMTAAPSMNRLNRAGCRRAGWMGAWQWMRDGEKFASIKLRDACCSEGQKS